MVKRKTSVSLIDKFPVQIWMLLIAVVALFAGVVILANRPLYHTSKAAEVTVQAGGKPWVAGFTAFDRAITPSGVQLLSFLSPSKVWVYSINEKTWKQKGVALSSWFSTDPNWNNPPAAILTATNGEMPWSGNLTGFDREYRKNENNRQVLTFYTQDKFWEYSVTDKQWLRVGWIGDYFPGHHWLNFFTVRKNNPTMYPPTIGYDRFIPPAGASVDLTSGLKMYTLDANQGLRFYIDSADPEKTFGCVVPYPDFWKCSTGEQFDLAASWKKVPLVGGQKPWDSGVMVGFSTLTTPQNAVLYTFVSKDRVWVYSHKQKAWIKAVYLKNWFTDSAWVN